MIMACKQDILDVTVSSEMISNAVKSFTMSKRLTRAVINASVLNILYHRMVLNQSDLKSKKLENISIMGLKRMNVKDPLLRGYIAWMKGIADAVDKSYLKEAFMFMKNPVNDEIIETYKFSLKYNTEDNKENSRTPSYVKRTTVELLQVINQLSRIDKLGENTVVEIELTYFDKTPRSYEPPGFQTSLEKQCLLVSSCNVYLGALKTGYHKLTCYGGGQTFDEQTFSAGVTEALANEVEKGKNPFETSTVENASVHLEEPEEDPGTKISKPKVVPQKLDISNITVSDHDKISVLSDNSIQMTEEQYTCLCQMNTPLEADIIECLDCRRCYHAPCHGYLSKEDAYRADFVCVQCSNKDTLLYQMSSAERPLFCRIRLVLYYLDKRSQLPQDILNLMPENHRNSVIEKLEHFKILVGKKNSKVNQVALRQIIETFFLLDDSQML